MDGNNAIDNLIIDPGCQMATKLYDSLPENPSKECCLLLAAIEVHKEKTIEHDLDCFAVRPIN